MLDSLKKKVPFIKSLTQRYGYFKNECLIKNIRANYGSEHQNKTFYVIGGVMDESAGLFAYVRAVFLHATYAKQHGYIPVVDMHNFPNQYQKENTIHENVWEIFFKQPDNYHLYNIKRAQRVVFCKPFSRPNYGSEWRMEGNRLIKNSDALRAEFKQVIRLNTTMENSCAERYEALIGSARVLGVLARGTDYQLKQPKYQPIQPSADQLIEEAKEVMQSHNCTKLFLASEDAEIVAKFKAEFGAKLITNQQRLYSRKELEGVNSLSEIDERTKIDTAKEYLQSVYILSKCACFIAGRTAGSTGAYLMSDGFEYEHLWELGTYD
ncbi:MAG: hypothetical protein ACK5LR_02395 [Mangrovibacterium sp.]